MAFLGLPETSKMQIFASTLQHLPTDDINVSKIYPSGLIIGWGRLGCGCRGRRIYGGIAYIRDVNSVTYLTQECMGVYIRRGLIYGGALTEFYSILLVHFFFLLVSLDYFPVVTKSMHLQSTYTSHLRYLQSGAHLESSRTSAVELFLQK